MVDIKLRKIVMLVLLCVLLPTCCVAFSDMQGHWAEEAVTEVAEKNIMTGTEIGFLPDCEITREQFVTAVVRALDSKSTPSAKYSASVYEPYVKRAYELGIITAYDEAFRPKDAVSREEAVTILSRAFGFLAGYNNARQYSDYSKIAEYARSAISFATQKGIISGYPDGTVRPQAKVTRAEAAAMLQAVLKINSKEPGFVIGYPRVSAKGKKGSISLDISTNIPCVVYYSVYGADMQATPSKEMLKTRLVSIARPNSQQTAEIKGEIGKTYNLYLVAIAPDGTSSNVVSIRNITPLPYAEGAGTRENPYAIYTAFELDMMRFFPDSAFVLKRDITLSDRWTPISEFRGIFDGDGHSIKGLYVNEEGSYAGLFARLQRSEVKNLTVTGQVSAKSSAGILAGEASDAKISHVVTAGNVTVRSNNAGGIAGENAGVIENSLSAVYLVEADSFAGGVTGQNYGIIRDTVSAAHTVTSNIYAGGISAMTIGGQIKNSVSASVNVWNNMQINCERVTTAKSDAVLENNFGYDGMRTNSANDVNMSDNGNGANIGWEELIDKAKLCELVGWEASAWTGGGREERYLIPRPSGTAAPELTAGVCEYSPVRVSNTAELLGMIDNPNMHYLLTKSIHFSENLRWRPASDGNGEADGFNGSFDGGGYAIYNMNLTASAETGHSGLFGIISAGTVRNLKLIDPIVEMARTTGVIASVSYGRIDNCAVMGMKLSSTADSTYIGGITGYNYGLINNAEVAGNIDSIGRNTVIGGISAHNEGAINDVSFTGEISVLTETSGETVAGGICGYNAQGTIYNAYSKASLTQRAGTIYGGGICGIQTDGEVYKCSSDGELTSLAPTEKHAISYMGGISALSSNSIIMHSFSTADITQYSDKNYAGGIVGYNETGIIQNTYTTSAVRQLVDSVISAKYESYAGGIAAVNEQGQLIQNLAANKEIIPVGKSGRIIAAGTEDAVQNNYAAKMTLPQAENKIYDGTTLHSIRLTYKYIMLPVAQGGVLGFSEEIWTAPKTKNYTFPVLRGVKNQELFTN